MGNNHQSRRKKKQKKGEKNKEKRLHQRAYMLLQKLTSKEITQKIFYSLEIIFSRQASMQNLLGDLSGVFTWTLCYG